MTPVICKFQHPGGEPCANATFTIALRRAGFLEADDLGISIPDVVTAVTDDTGTATVNLAPLNQPYYLNMSTPGVITVGDECAPGTRFTFYVPISTIPVRLENLIVTSPTWSQTWDETAIQIIIDAKANAQASADRAKIEADRAELAADGVEQHAIDAANSAAAAKASETAAASSATAAETSKNEASASAQAAEASKNAAAGSATTATDAAAAALASKNAAANSATEADASKTAAASSATGAANSATQAAQSKTDAATSATQAAASASAASTAETNAETAQAAAEQARDEAVAAAGSVTGVISDLGGWDASGGAFPAKPAVGSGFWKITVGGTMGGVQYGVGDTLMYSKNLDEFYKIDNTESVTSVNGKTGVVVVTKADVGLDIGLGAANAQTVADANTFLTPGQMVTLGGASTNIPTSAGFLLVTGAMDANNVTQFWVERTAVGNVPRTYERSKVTGTWGPWGQVVKGTNWMPITTSISANLLDHGNMTYYVQGSTVTELPLASTGILQVLFRGDAGGAALRCVQEYTPYEPANGSSRTWRRTRDETNTWSNWFRTDTGALGTAAMGTLTTLATDTTANRVTKVGDFGLGGNVVGVAESAIDAIAYTGLFFVNALGANKLPVQRYGYLMTQAYSAGYANQRFLVEDGSAMYERAQTGGTWRAWKTFHLLGDLGIGGQLIQLTTLAELNALNPSQQGFYFAAGAVITAAGIPKGYGGVILHYGRGGDTAVQHYTSTGTNDVQVYTRTYNTVSVGWSPWVKNLTSLDVTSTATDSGAGKLLKNGDWGVGGVAVTLAATSLNTVIISGKYYVGDFAGSSNLPEAQNGYLEVSAQSGLYVLQEFTGVSSGNRYARRMTNGTWQGWVLQVQRGSFGVGTPIIINDPNTALTPGDYSVQNGVNTPVASGWYDMKVFATNQEVTQVLYEIGSNRNLTYMRLRNGTSMTWTPWQCMTPTGVHQAWASVTAQRAIGTVYTNDTGRPIQVNILVAASAANVGVGIITSGSVGTYGTHAYGPGALISTGPVIIPPGATYQCTISNGSATLHLWTELR